MVKYKYSNKHPPPPKYQKANKKINSNRQSNLITMTGPLPGVLFVRGNGQVFEGERMNDEAQKGGVKSIPYRGGGEGVSYQIT